MAENTNISLTIDAWAKIVIERWENKMNQLKIYHTGKLLNSFKHFIITQANGNPEKITFAFEVYGKFVDMGVGREINRGNSGDLGFTPKRKPKPWYSKIFWSQFMWLKDELAKKYAIKGQMAILTEFEQLDIGQSLASGLSTSNSHSHSSKTNSDSYTVAQYKKVRMK